MFKWARTVARIDGIPVRVDLTWVLVAAAVWWTMSLEMADVVSTWPRAIALALLPTLGLFASILAHELAHALQARQLGLQVHAVTLFVFGGVTEMQDGLRRPRHEFLVAAIGPWVSLGVAAVLGLTTAALDQFALLPQLTAVTGLLAWLNLGLGIFNLLPGAPLDGGRVLEALLWRLLEDRRRAARGAAVAGMLLGVGVWALAAWMVRSQPDTLPSALWLTLIAAFMVAMAFRQWRRPVPSTPPSAVEEVVPGPRAGNADEAAGDVAAAVPMAAGGSPAARGDAMVLPHWAGRVLRWGLGFVIVLAFAIVPMPVMMTFPGPTFTVEDLVDVSGPTTEVSGDLVMVTVYLRQPGMAEVLHAMLVEDRRLHPRQELVPAGLSTEEYLAGQRRVFASSLELAAAAALSAAGEPVEAGVEVAVRDVLPDGPAAGVLAPDDVLLALDGEPITDLEELAATTATLEPGTEVALRIQRDGQARDVTVTIGMLPGGERAGIGVTLGAATTRLQLPREVSIADRQIGGPSAGLVTALAIFDLVTDEDLVAGRRIAATGTMMANGTVGRIGNIPEKVTVAIGQDADVLLVPSSQAAEAVAAADGRLQVVGVDTIDEAIAALG